MVYCQSNAHLIGDTVYRGSIKKIFGIQNVLFANNFIGCWQNLFFLFSTKKLMLKVRAAVINGVIYSG